MPISNVSIWRLRSGCITIIVISRSSKPTETFTIAGPCSLRSQSSRLAVARWWCGPVRIFRPPSIPFRKRADASVSKSASTKLRRRSGSNNPTCPCTGKPWGRESCARTARSFCTSGIPTGCCWSMSPCRGCPSNWRPNPSKDKGCKGWSWWTVAARPQSSGASCTRRH